MPKPLVSNDPNPKDVQFSHFGVLDDGKRSKGAAITSIVINCSIILLLLFIGALIKTNPEFVAKKHELFVPVKVMPKKPPPPPPPPKVLPPVPKIKMEPPKVNIPPAIQPPPEIKPMPMMPKPVVMNTPAPKRVIAVAAPKAVSFSHPHAASIANHDAHPSAVSLGYSQIRASNSPRVATPVNLGGGMRGMPASNTGNGPRAVHLNFGNGSPSGTSTRRGAVEPVSGFARGVRGGTGHGLNGPQQVRLGEGPRAARFAQPVVRAATLAKPPVVTSQPRAQFTAAALAAHVQGEVSISVIFHADGHVSVVHIVHGLGFGLNQEAEKVAEGIRFRPALNSDGRPVDFPTTIIVRFVSNS